MSDIAKSNQRKCRIFLGNSLNLLFFARLGSQLINFQDAHIAFIIGLGFEGVAVAAANALAAFEGLEVSDQESLAIGMQMQVPAGVNLG